MDKERNRPMYKALMLAMATWLCIRSSKVWVRTPVLPLLAATILCISGCTEQALYQKMDNMPRGTWARTDRSVHEVQVTDTLGTYDFYLNIRIGNDYPFANMYLFVNTTFPSGRTARDTVECILAEASGRWLGKGLGDMYDNRILFKPAVRFPVAGTYHFSLEQGMRTDHLPQVLDVGMSIYPSKRR
jgi:gliding motility-associated lipoprotein GldH